MTASRQPFVTSAELEAQCASLSAVGVGPSGTPQDLVDTALESATELMWHLTGRQFGLWTETVRPHLNGEIVYQLELGEYPITSVQAVKIDGATLPTSAYWVAEDRFLVRSNGEQWPSTQLQYLSDTEEDTFSVTYTWGVAPPPAVRSGARRLACELIAMGSGTGSALSDRVRSVSRQGTNFELVSPQDLLESNGRTGIYEVDLAISAYNSGGNVAPPVVMSPDSFLGDRVPTGQGAVQGAIGPTGPAGPMGPAGPAGPSSGWVTAYTTTLSAAASTIAVSGVSSVARWAVHVVTRSTGTGSSPTELRMVFSNDLAFDYEWIQIGASNSGGVYTARNEASNNAQYIKLGLITQTAAGTQRYSHVSAETHSATALGTYVYTASESTASHTTSTETYTTQNSGIWRNVTSPVTLSPVLSLGSGQFAAGTTVRVFVLTD